MRRLRSVFLVWLMVCLPCLAGRTFAQGDSDLGSTLTQIQKLIHQSETSEALTQLRRALKRFPREPNLYNFLGVIEAQSSGYAAAEASFRKAIELGPRLAAAYFNLGRLYQENAAKDPNAVSKAVETYKTLLAHHPANAEARYQCARLVCLQGRFGEALTHLSRLSAADRKLSHVSIITLSANAGLGRQGAAREAGSRLLSSQDLTEADLLPFLTLLGKHGEASTAVSLLQKLDQGSKLSSAGLRELALLYERSERLPEAKQALERVAQSATPTPSLLLDLARISHKQKDPQAALGYLGHARDLSPQDPQIHYLFGVLCAELDLSEDAYESFRKAAVLDGQNADYNLAAGAVALQRRAAAESIPFLTKYRTQRPKDPRGHLALGAAYYHAGQLDEAQQELRLACESAETASAAHYYLGRAASQSDDFELAARELKAALEANPKNLDAAAELGLVRLRTKDYRLAEQTLAKVLIEDPDHYKANLHLLNLYQRTRDARSSEQEQRFEQVKKRRSDREQSLLRRVEFIK
jgi:tetratricopeptide (TPR) repeat protein